MPRPRTPSPQTRAVLTTLLAADGWTHGYDLSKQTGLTSGTLYPLLMRLSDQGLLDDRWQAPERPGRPPRHAYRLTTQGARLARDLGQAAAGARLRRRRATKATP